MKAQAAHQKATVSGEIMSPARRTRRSPVTRKIFEAIDADFEMVTVTLEPGQPRRASQAPARGVKTLSRKQSRSASAAALILVASAVAWGLSGNGKPNEAGVDLANVTSSIERSGPQVLVKVDGTVVNQSLETTAIAPVAVTLTDRNALTTRYLVRVPAARLAPGEGFAFSTRLSVPSDNAKSVQVGFAE